MLSFIPNNALGRGLSTVTVGQGQSYSGDYAARLVSKASALGMVPRTCPVSGSVSEARFIPPARGLIKVL